MGPSESYTSLISLTIKICGKVVLIDFTLIAVLLAFACVLFFIRMILVVWRNIKQPLYEDLSPDAMEVIAIAEKQKKMFR